MATAGDETAAPQSSFYFFVCLFNYSLTSYKNGTIEKDWSLNGESLPVCVKYIFT